MAGKGNESGAVVEAVTVGEVLDAESEGIGREQRIGTGLIKSAEPMLSSRRHQTALREEASERLFDEIDAEDAVPSLSKPRHVDALSA